MGLAVQQTQPNFIETEFQQASAACDQLLNKRSEADFQKLLVQIMMVQTLFYHILGRQDNQEVRLLTQLNDERVKKIQDTFNIGTFYKAITVASGVLAMGAAVAVIFPITGAMIIQNQELMKTIAASGSTLSSSATALNTVTQLGDNTRNGIRTTEQHYLEVGKSKKEQTDRQKSQNGDQAQGTKRKIEESEEARARSAGQVLGG
jgi:peroxiredoxin family protein